MFDVLGPGRKAGDCVHDGRERTLEAAFQKTAPVAIHEQPSQRLQEKRAAAETAVIHQ